MRKNPDVDTTFLPDKERDAARARLEAEREKEWAETQEKMKATVITVTYSYWDGAGHRRKIKVTQGTSIGAFIERARVDLASKFKYLKRCNAENLIYVKEDLIIPHNMTFYDFVGKNCRQIRSPVSL